MKQKTSLPSSITNNLKNFNVVKVNIDGIDYSGKSTLITALSHMLPSAIITKEPNDSKLRDIIINRPDLPERSRYFMLLADRYLHMTNLFETIAADPAKYADSDRNIVIISDRSYISGMTYSSLGSGTDLVFQKLAHGMTEYDLNIAMDISFDTFKTRYDEDVHKDEIEKMPIDNLYYKQSRMFEVLKNCSIPYVLVKSDDNMLIHHVFDIIESEISRGREELCKRTSNFNNIKVAPVAPKKEKKSSSPIMMALGFPFTYEDMISIGWKDETLISHGYALYNTRRPRPSVVAVAPVAPVMPTVAPVPPVMEKEDDEALSMLSSLLKQSNQGE